MSSTPREPSSHEQRIGATGKPAEQPASESNQQTLTFLDRGISSPKEGIRYVGDYELLHEIARGGMGVVFKARQVTLNRSVAVKMILGGQLARPEDVQRFHTEAEAAAQLDHPGIVPIYEVGQHEGQRYFSMGFVDGRSLSKKVADSPLPAREAAEIVRAVAESVQYAHDKGVIHRDLKPGNILLDKDGKPRVTDFGLAKLTESGSDLTGTGQVLGTPSYMPPEQAAGQASAVGRQSDVYSLGAILYCLLTGRPPFQAATPLETLLLVRSQEPVPPIQLNGAIPLDLNTISLKCLEKDPARRYRSAQELADELQRHLSGEPIFARPIGLVERSWRWCRRRPLIPSIVAAVLAVSIAAGMLFRHATAVERRHSLRREVVTAVHALENAPGAAVPYALRDLQSLPREMVISELESRYAQVERRPRLALAFGLAQFGAGQTAYLCSQIRQSSPEDVDNFVAACHRDRGPSLETVRVMATGAHSEQDWTLKARLAIVALLLGDDSIAAEMCRIADRPDPVQRTVFVNELATWHGDLGNTDPHGREPSDPALRSALCMAIGSIPTDKISLEGSATWQPRFINWYQTAPDAATHSAADWALRRWKVDLPAVPNSGQPEGSRDWFVNSLGMTMLKIQPGQFKRSVHLRRSPDETIQTIRLTRPYFLADRETSIDQFRTFLKDTNCPNDDKPPNWDWRLHDPDMNNKPGNYPQRFVCWQDAVLFCNWLSHREGLAPCYERIMNRTKPGNNQDPLANANDWQLSAGSTGYRLPTETEWEYSCRAGTTTIFASGADAELLRPYAVYATGNMQLVAPCASRLPNGWGLFDMHGNVWEWCHDRHGDYEGVDLSDPMGPSREISEAQRVIKGGSYYIDAARCKSENHAGLMARYCDGTIGFRVALVGAQ
jgi:formylglycine-generating enzyme required for sulfatase activity